MFFADVGARKLVSADGGAVSDLEKALIHHLEEFLTELGGEFCFVGRQRRQRRLRIGGEWYRVDLLFFHRKLRCLIVIDLKVGKFTHADAGQMHLYLNYAREHWTRPEENPPVGLSVTRLCAMNLLLHGIGGESEEDLPVVTKDALAGKHGEYEIVLANPPFGKKSSVTIVNEAGESSKESLIINRDDFWASTSNKQLNFLQHIFTILKQHGRAAVVLPDNVLFEGGTGETIRRELLKQADVHTLLRLPTGIFYAQGVKANVLFFDRKPAQEKPHTTKLWIYDLRTNLHFTLKENTLKRTDVDDFVACCHPKNRHDRKESERFRSFTYEELTKRDKVNLDIFWLKDDALEESANLPAPEIIAADIAADLEAALEQFATIAEDLKPIR